jgi:hypothetical protein
MGPRFQSAAVLISSGMLVFGGYTSNGVYRHDLFSRDVMTEDLSSDGNWTSLPSLPSLPCLHLGLTAGVSPTMAVVNQSAVLLGCTAPGELHQFRTACNASDCVQGQPRGVEHSHCGLPYKAGPPFPYQWYGCVCDTGYDTGAFPPAGANAQGAPRVFGKGTASSSVSGVVGHHESAFPSIPLPPQYLCLPHNNCNDLPGPCNSHALCRETGPALSTCTCNAGYTGDGVTCAAIDNCKLPTRGHCDVSKDRLYIYISPSPS